MKVRLARIAVLAAAPSVALLLAAIPARSAGVEQFRSIVPQANVDGFIQRCREGNVADASCWCMAKSLNETKNGAFLLDMLGFRLEKRSEAERKAEVLRIVNRHGLRVSEAQAAMARGDEIVKAMSDKCG